MEERQPRNYEKILNYGTPFYFDPEKMLFVAGNRDSQTTFSPFTSEGFFKDMLNIRREGAAGKNEIEDTDVLLYVTLGPLIQLPLSRKILAEQIVPDENKKRELSERVRKVMRRVYQDLNPSFKLPLDRYDSMSIFANFDETGKIRLNTFGFCACLNPDPDSMFFEYNHDINSPLSYFTHNIDSESQRMSLMAGMGTVAFVVKEMNRG